MDVPAAGTWVTYALILGAWTGAVAHSHRAHRAEVARDATVRDEFTGPVSSQEYELSGDPV